MTSRYHRSSGDGGPHRMTKSRPKVSNVKPILKKFSSSAKSSLDLDRSWPEQAGTWGFATEPDFPGGHSVAFVPDDGMRGPGGGIAGNGRRLHARSTSQTSNGSNSRIGGFVHPFQQTPRTATPPLSYANSLVSLDNARDCSPTITEDEDNNYYAAIYPDAHINARSHSPHLHHPPAHSQASFRRPSLASQRTSSFSDVNSIPQLRVATNRSHSALSSRLAHDSFTRSQSDLHLHQPLSSVDSPTGSIGSTFPPVNSPSSPSLPSVLSPLRTSLDMATFGRNRSRSDQEKAKSKDKELDSEAKRQELIQAARAEFAKKERIKEEKIARYENKMRERRDAKEAHRLEKEAAQWKKGLIRPAASLASTPPTLSVASTPGVGTPSGTGYLGASNNSRHDLTSYTLSSSKASRSSKRTAQDLQGEKDMSFASHNYDHVIDQPPPAFGTSNDAGPETRPQVRRGSSAKQRTHSFWQGFILWFRTKLLRLGGRVIDKKRELFREEQVQELEEWYPYVAAAVQRSLAPAPHPYQCRVKMEWPYY